LPEKYKNEFVRGLKSITHYIFCKSFVDTKHRVFHGADSEDFVILDSTVLIGQQGVTGEQIGRQTDGQVDGHLCDIYRVRQN